MEGAEDIDLFGSTFTGKDEGEVLNVYNLEKVAHLCENLTPDGGVKKLLIKRGTGDVVPRDANVTIKYVAFTEFEKKPFERIEKPVNLDIGMTNFEGLSISLASMRKGEQANFYIAPEYAFGKLGCPPSIPPNSTCLYVIELLDYEDMGGAGEYYHRSEDERQDASYEVFVSVIKMKRKEAKALFGKQNYGRALSIYKSLIHKLNRYTDKENEDEFKKFMVTLNSNAALCYLKMSNFEACVTSSNVTLNYDLKYVKALYFKGKALSKMGKTDLALECLLEAKKISPKNEEINEELHFLDTYVSQFLEVEKELSMKMMQELRSKEITKDKKTEEPCDISVLREDVRQEFEKHLSDMRDSSDLSEEMIISTDSFSIAEISALEAMAKSFQLRVYNRTQSDEADTIIIISKC